MRKDKQKKLWTLSRHTEKRSCLKMGLLGKVNWRSLRNLDGHSFQKRSNMDELWELWGMPAGTSAQLKHALNLNIYMSAVYVSTHSWQQKSWQLSQWNPKNYSVHHIQICMLWRYTEAFSDRKDSRDSVVQTTGLHWTFANFHSHKDIN